MSRKLRITVRGGFDNLSAQQQAELVAAQAEHDFMNTRYTAEGDLFYDLPARPFYTFRFADEVDDEAAINQAVVRAEEKAAAWMAARGYATKNVTSTVVDMSQVPLGKRGRRAAEKGLPG
jgi:uncharacterized protein DUF6204